ncbi:hypothetical protein [Salininema proteolyticum]|uniref:Uncharacterized protein n=1 Tax=Salininema proteolyticum TaxID=1607685 RepID=A0ABV8TXX5_9ACTN
MAISLNFQTNAELSPSELLAYFVRTLDAEMKGSEFAEVDGLQIDADITEAEDLGRFNEIVGDRDVATVGFRLDNELGEQARVRAYTRILEATSGFLLENPRVQGILDLNWERIVVERRAAGDLTFDTAWNSLPGLEVPAELYSPPAGAKVQEVDQVLL